LAICTSPFFGTDQTEHAPGDPAKAHTRRGRSVDARESSVGGERERGQHRQRQRPSGGRPTFLDPTPERTAHVADPRARPRNQAPTGDPEGQPE
jgi:hypothetical protein